MRTLPALLAVLGALAIAQDACGDEVPWEKLVSQDGRFSLHYPAGFRATETSGMVTLVREATHEELWVLDLAKDSMKGPGELAEPVLRLLRAKVKDLRVAELGGNGDGIAFVLGGTADGRAVAGVAVVARSGQSAIWGSYFAPTPGFDQARGLALVAGVLASVAPGSTSRSPAQTAASAQPSVPDAASIREAAGPGALLGFWSVGGPSGSVVDSRTGAYQRVASYAESFAFEPDGRFVQVVAGAG
jgi:hypothetical protein